MGKDRSIPADAEPSFAEMADLLHLGMAYRVVTAADGTGARFTALGRLCRQLTGVSAEEALADPERLVGRILPEYREALQRAERAAAASLSRFEIEVRMRGADGLVGWRRIAATPTPQPDGAIVWNGILMDVTEVRRAAERLEAQRQRLEAAVEATGLGFWEWDVRSDRLIWSERNAAMFGLPAERTVMTIEGFNTLVHPDDLKVVRDVYFRTREGGGGDFVAEYRTAYQPGGRTRWIEARGRLVKDGDEVGLVVGTSLDISERKASEDRRALLLSELAHRAKNGIQVMMGIVAQTSRGVGSVQQFREVLMARLKALADSQDLVTAAGGRPVPLRRVVLTSLSPFDATRFDVDDLGDATVLGEVAMPLALLLHELATNAVKYGALSAPGGRVVVNRGEDAAGLAVLCWKECDGPPVQAIRRRGFGMRLLDIGLSAQGGKVEAAFDPEGFAAKIHFPTADPASPPGG